MKTFQLLFFLFVPGLIFSCGESEGADISEIGKQPENTYYINTQKDFDEYSGTYFVEGSKILFSKEKSFEGQFKFLGNGTAENPNILTAYDPETGDILTEWIDDKPVINGLGKVTASLYLKNGSFWEINNIEVTNTNGTKDQQGKILGINVVANDAGLVQDVTIKNCYVHDVNGNVGGKETGGIHVNVLGDKVKTKFHKLTIENNRVAHVGGVGISNKSSWGSINEDDYLPWTEFAIRNNRVEHTGRNGIIVRYAQKPIVEYNIVAYSSRYDTGHSIFNFNTVDCIVQYNEAYGNTSNSPDDIDHGGFDADYNSRGTIIQYNYSHDNNWFCGIMRKAYNTDITIRYNISQNELLGAFLYGFPKETGVKDVKIYNNTVYFEKGTGTRVFVEAGEFRTPTETIFTNNILYFEDKPVWGFEPDETCVFENNLYYNLSPKGVNALTADPMFVNPGKGGTDIDMTDRDRLKGYRLKNGSPAKGSGKKMEDNGGHDFGANSINENLSRGAFQ